MNERELVDERRSVAELIKKRYHGKKTMKKGSICFSLLRDNYDSQALRLMHTTIVKKDPLLSITKNISIWRSSGQSFYINNVKISF